MNEIDGIWIKIGAKIDSVLQAFDQIKAMASVQLNTALRDVGSTISEYVSAPLKEVATLALKTGSEMEQTRIAFTTMLGSAGAATKFLGELKAFAAGTPFEFPGLVDAARRLQALGFAADQVIPSLTAIGNASAALGGGAAMIDRVTLALGQMQSKGKVSAQEINQLAEAGIGAWKILAEGMGKSIPQVMALAEKGMINAARAVPEILEKLNTQFGGMMQKQAETIAGQWSNLQDRLTFILMDLGEALSPTAQRILNALQPMVGIVEALIEAFKSLSPNTQLVITAMLGLVAAIGPLLVALGTFGLAVSSLSAGLATLGVTSITLAGTMTTLGLAIAGAAGAFAGWHLGKWLYDNIEGVRRFGDAIADLIAKIPGVQKFIDSLAGVPAANKSLADSVAMLEAKLKAKGITIDKTGLSLDEYSRRLRNVALGIAPTTEAVKKGTDENKKHAESWLLTETNMAKAGAAAKQVAHDIESGWKKIGDILYGLPKTFEAFTSKITTAANFDSLLSGLNKQIHDISEGFGNKIPEAIRKGMALQLILAKNEITEFKRRADEIALAEAFEKANAAVFKMAGNMKELGKAGLDYLQSVGLSAVNMTATATQQVVALDNAFKSLGTTWSGQLVSAANKTKHEFESVVLAMEAGMVSAVDFQKALIKYLEAQIQANKATGDSWVELQEQLDSGKRKLGELTGEGEKAAGSLEKSSKKTKEAADGMTKAWGDFGKQVSTILTDFGKDMASAIVHSKNFGEAATKAAGAIKEAFMRLVVEGAIKEMMKGLDGISGMLGGLGKQLNGLFSSIFGGGGSSGGGGGAGGGGGGTFGAGGGGALGSLNLVTGITNAITGVLGVLQGRRMEQDIGRIEVSMREAVSQLISLQHTFNKYLPLLEELPQLRRLEGIETALQAGLAGDLLGSLLGSLDNASQQISELPGDLIAANETLSVPLTRVATVVEQTTTQSNSRISNAFEALGKALSSALGGQQLLTEINTFRLTNNTQLRIIAEGIMGVYNVLAKSGTQSSPGSPARNPLLPSLPGTGGGNPTPVTTIQTVVNNPRTNDPFTLGMQVGQGVNAVLPVRV